MVSIGRMTVGRVAEMVAIHRLIRWHQDALCRRSPGLNRRREAPCSPVFFDDARHTHPNIELRLRVSQEHSFWSQFGCAIEPLLAHCAIEIG